MFSENNKVSGRQLGRMTFIETVGTTGFLALNIVGRHGSDGIVLLLIVILSALLYTKAMFSLAKVINRLESKRWIRIIESVFLIILLAKFLVMTGVIVNALADVARMILIPSVSSFLIMAVTIIAIIYCINGGIEARGRACEALFFFVLIPVVIICVMLVPKMQFVSIIPDFDFNIKHALMDYILLMWFFAPAEIFLLTKDCYFNTEGVRKNVYFSILLSGGINIAIFAAAIGIYGENTVRGMEYPVLRLMQISGIPGDFLNRQEGIMSIFLIISMFCGAWALIYHINEIVKKLFMNGRSLKASLYASSAAVVAVILIYAFFMGKYNENIVEADIGGMELEEREFVMSIIIDKSDEELNFYYETAKINDGGSEEISTGSIYKNTIATSVKDAEERLQFNNAKKIDYSHMKVLILDKDLIEDNEQMKKLVMEVSDQLKFAENIVVCAIEMSGIDEDGEYGKTVEELTKRQEEYKNSEIFRLNRLFSQKEGSVTIPLIDSQLNLLGSGIITDTFADFQYKSK